MGQLTDGNPRPVVDCSEDLGRAKQSMKDECDVNQILARFQSTGVITHLAQRAPQFLDVSEVPDYQTALNQVRAADDFFMSLPSKVRRHFDNDPAELLDAVSDPERVEELQQLGLGPVLGAQIPPEPPPDPSPAPEPEPPPPTPTPEA